MAIIDYKPQIRQAIETTGLPVDERVVEAVDQLLDPAIPNSIYNSIAYLVLQGEVHKTTTLMDKMRKKAIGE